MRLRFQALAALFAALLLQQHALPQAGTGSVQGVVRDASGAVLAGAGVVVTHKQTAQEFRTETNQIGFYVFPALQPGRYTLRAEAPGMQPWQGEFLLQTGQTATVDPVLNVAAPSTQITVVGDVTSLVTTTTPTLGNVLERERVEQLPLNGRFFNNLVATTTPGVEGVKVYGIRWAMEYVQDGAVLADVYGGGGTINTRPPGIDSIQEYRVETSNSSAKMSRPATTIVTTRSGTNEIHGSAFETLRNNGLGVARARQDYYTKPPHLVRNEFGASLGGPVYLPKLYNGKNRTFFFFAYEAYRNMSGSTTSATMPTAAMRQGDFSGLIDGQGRRYTLYDPWTTDSNTWARQPFPNNQVPASRQSPMYQQLLSLTPLPTNNDNPLVAPNWFGPGPNNRWDHTETTRIDHRLSNRDQIFGRFTYGHSYTYAIEGTRKVPILADDSSNSTRQPARNVSAVLSWIHTFSPTFFSETLATGSQEDWFISSRPEGMQSLVDRLGFPNPFKNPDLSLYATSVGFTMDYFSQPPRGGFNRNITLDQNLTKIHGRHELQFGGRYRQNVLHILPAQPRLNTRFNSLATSLYDPRSGTAYGAVPQTGHDSANFYLGIPAYFQAQLVRRWFYLTQNEFSLYFQDNFKVNSRLTLNLGLRWDGYPAIRERNRQMVGFNPKTKAIITATSLDRLYALGATTPEVVADYQAIGVKFETAEQAGLPRDLVYGNWADFNPRVGFAWRLAEGRRAAVLRGGYSIFGYSTSTWTWTNVMRLNPPTALTRVYNLNAAAQSPDGRQNWGLRSVPSVVVGVNARNLLDGRNTGGNLRGAFDIHYFDPHQPTMRAHEWNLTLERELVRNTVFRAGYVGTHGSRLDQFHYHNAPPNAYIWYVTRGEPLPTGEYASVAMRPFENTAFGNINEYRKIGWSNANAVNLEAERRYTGGYGFQVFYVMTNAFRAGGNSRYDDNLPTPDVFLPGAVPADDHERNRFLFYRRDAETPKHRLRWNWIVDLPFGRGKKFGANAGRLLGRLIGGWQLAGSGSVRSNYWALPETHWGYLGNVEIYGTKYPIEDCRSGTCYRGYLYWNGYIPAHRINSYDTNGKPNGVMGVPREYKPACLPIFPTPADGGSRSDPNFQYYESNTTWVRLKNGSEQRVSFDTNLHPWRNQYFAGPLSFNLDASLFKSVPIREAFVLRFNADFFNVLNMPGMPQPGGDGILSLRNSAQAPRQLQLTLRLSW